ncbi:unnamed protein product [Rotaria sordida]|uniref:Major facilitator superfamily (MFS) profile domain-containing protein n=1 Tax=Rotaria sordida TaxID=392033 RepID=A0A813WKY0_9BILA|nr:unnamed protein product [Rotaria sordida]
MVAWGIVMTLMGLVNSYGSLIACRLFLGAFEAGLFPGVSFYLSSWYKRCELLWRVSIFFSAAALAGAFGGVLAYGISKMGGVGGQEGWRWIFYLEGIATVVIGSLAFFLINDFPSDQPKFLTESECKRVTARLQNDAGAGANEQFKNRRRDRLYGSTQLSVTPASANSASYETDVQQSDIWDLTSEDDKRRWGYAKMSEKEIRDLGDRHVAFRYIL